MHLLFLCHRLYAVDLNKRVPQPEGSTALKFPSQNTLVIAFQFTITQILSFWTECN